MRPRITTPASSPRCVSISSPVAAPAAYRSCGGVSCRPGRCAATSRRETWWLPSSTRSSALKKACGVALRSTVKNSASDIGTPSSTFLSELTEGLTRFCSMREMSPLVTPARRASSRCDRPNVVRTLRRRAPTSMLMVFRILDNKRKNIAPVAGLVHFIYHPAPSHPHRVRHAERQRPLEPIGTRSVLVAVHRQPPVQGETPTARESERHALLDPRGTADPRWGRGTVVRQCGSRPPRDHSGGCEPARDHGLRAALPDGSPGGVRAGERTGENRARAARSRVFHQLRIGIRRHGAENRPRLAPCAR